MSELDALDPSSEQVKLSTGTFLILESLKARQFFKLLRIVTHGALPVMRDLSIFSMDPNADPAEFGAKLLSVMVLAIPDAEDETIDFLRSMCKPAGLIERRSLNRQDLERNAELWTRLDSELTNPELEDLVTIVETIVRREAADIQALGKRLAAMFNLARKTGQVPNLPTQASPTQTSSAGSPDVSTFSPASTDGPTTTSPTSPSDASGSASPPSENAASTTSGGQSNG